MLPGSCRGKCVFQAMASNDDNQKAFLERAKAVADLKFTYVVFCQVYGNQIKSGDIHNRSCYTNILQLMVKRWQEWIEYVNQDQPCNTNDGSSLSEHCDSAGSSTLKKPSRIDNSDLIYDSSMEDPSNTSEIIETLQKGCDYVLLPQEVWNQLRSW